MIYIYIYVYEFPCNQRESTGIQSEPRVRLPVTCFTTGVAHFTTKSLLHLTCHSHFQFASRSLEFSCSLSFHFTSNRQTPADFQADFNELPCQTPGRLLEPTPSPLPSIRRESAERDSWLAFSSSSHLCIVVCVCSVFCETDMKDKGSRYALLRALIRNF